MKQFDNATNEQDYPTISMAVFRKVIFGELPKRSYLECFDIGYWALLCLRRSSTIGDSYTYAVTTSKPTLSIPSSWEIGAGEDGYNYGYLLKEPLTESQWQVLRAASAAMSNLAPVTEWEGTSAPIYEWHPDRRYTFDELLKALPERAAA